MAKNKVGGDDTFQCAAPGGGVVAGLVYKYNKLACVALATAAAGEQVAFAISGQYRVVCAGEVMAVGQMLYVSGTGVTAVPNAYPAGVCMETNAGAATSTIVLLNSGTIDAEIDLTVVLPGTLEVTGDTSVNTDKFKVIATSGNTTIAGTLGVTGDTKVNTDKVVITAASGNTAIAGTLGCVGDFKVNTDKVVVTASSGATAFAGKVSANAGIAMETASAAETGAAITQSKHSGKITTVSLTTAAAASYSVTLTNTKIAATSIVLANIGFGTCNQGEPVLGTVTVTANTAVFKITNRDAAAALNGTLEIFYVVINPA